MPFKGLKATQKTNIWKTKVIVPFSSELVSFVFVYTWLHSWVK